MKLIWIIVPLCSMVLLALGVMYNKSQSDPNVLVVGTESAFPPFEMLDAQGNLIGFDCDVIQAVARKLGKKVEFKIMSFENLIVALQQKKVDLIIAAISITEPRKAALTLVPYHSNYCEGQDAHCKNGTFPLVFWKSIPHNATKIEDLAPLQPLVSVQAGSIQKEVIASFPFLKVRLLDTIPDLIMDIKYGKSLACMLEPVVLESIKARYPEVVVLDVPIPPSCINEGHGIGIRKEDTTLAKQVDQAIATLQQEGTLKTLEKKWLQHFYPSS